MRASDNCRDLCVSRSLAHVLLFFEVFTKFFIEVFFIVVYVIFFKVFLVYVIFSEVSWLSHAGVRG